MRNAAVRSTTLMVLGLALGCAEPGLSVDGEAASSKSDDTASVAPGAVLDCPVLVIGGSTGGVAAGLAAARASVDVCITEETDWLGGQLTSQALNASDDTRFTDTTGSTRTYLDLRHRMRARYGGRSNPGACWVSELCAEPSVAVETIDELLAPYLDSGRVRVFLGVAPAVVAKEGDRITGATFTRLADGAQFTIRAQQTIDATDLGDVTKLAGAAYRLGQEPRSDTDEADAPDEACRECVQAFTYDVLLEKRPASENHVIDRPAGYGKDAWVSGFGHHGFPMFGPDSVWAYRRVIGPGLGRPELSIMNWDAGGNDYPFGNIIDHSPDDAARHLERARQRALAYVYWLQTAADGHGYPYLKLRDDLLGSDTGVAKRPYIRESRRLRALTTIRTEDISSAYLPGDNRARACDDSLGIGFYPLDMHQNAAEGSGWPSGEAIPFQIPLGALVPETTDGLLAGSKNLGTTHLTNSAYRLHPIEWAIGEAAGALAAYATQLEVQPRDVFASKAKTRALQERLVADGVPVYWTDDVRPSDPDFASIQMVGVGGIMSPGELAFRPDGTATRGQVAVWLVRALGIATIHPAKPRFHDVPANHFAYEAVETLAQRGVVSGSGDGTFEPEANATAEQLKAMIGRATDAAVAGEAVPSVPSGELRRRVAAKALARVMRATFGY